MTKLSLRILFIILFSFTIVVPTISQASTQESIVKVFTTAVTYNYDVPWQTSGIESFTGSGCIISGKRILTNAHVVSNATFIEVQRHGDPSRFIASVIAVSHEADLALLQVENDNFFIGTTPLELGRLPELRDNVSIYGFPEGGKGLSVTQGIISRIEITWYVHSCLQLLGLQVDAAINSGNSGGPAVMNGKIVGIAMQAKEDAENIGFIIPTPIIRHFLVDLKDGYYDGFPEIGAVVQSLENAAFRSSLKLPDHKTGIYVSQVVPGTSADGLLLKGDVILSVDNHSIANDGTVLLRPGLRVLADYYINAHNVGGIVDVTIWRNGTNHNISIPLTTRLGDSRLVKFFQYDSPPEYYIVGGIILTPLSWNSLASWDEVPGYLKRYFYGMMREKVGEQVVIIKKLLPSKMTSGYQNAIDKRVILMNGQSFASFKELASLIDKALARDDPITLETGDHIVVVVSPQEHRKNEKKLLELYGIDEPCRVK